MSDMIRKHSLTSLGAKVGLRIRSFLSGNPDRFIARSRGVIHVGANDGAERHAYALRDLVVLWIEPLPSCFEALTQNLRTFPKQKAVRALVTDKDGADYEFNVSSNHGASSSIYQFDRHKEIWPEVSFTEVLKLKSTTLDSIIRGLGQPATAFDSLVLDVQGAELLVLKGACELVPHLRYIKAEAADFEAYRGACTIDSLTAQVNKAGFQLACKRPFAARRGIGTYFDVLYERRS